MTPELQSFIGNLPLPRAPLVAASPETMGSTTNTANLPDSAVVGSTLISFDGGIDPTIRESVALSLTAAQKVADNDHVVRSPELWVERHDMVLRGLNWIGEGIRTVDAKHTEANGSVHQAIIPFLTAAFGPGAAVTALVLEALNQLKQMNADSPWITLFERESRRFDVSEYRFATVNHDAEGNVALKIAAARFSVVHERVQVLFFTHRSTSTAFKVAHADFAANAGLLQEINAPLKAKTLAHTIDFIAGLNLTAGAAQP